MNLASRASIRRFLTIANAERRRAAFRAAELGFQLRSLLESDETTSVRGERPAGLNAPPLPAFLIIGAMKAGTTSLYAHLVDHPLVQPACYKEIHFYNSNFHRGMDWYRSNFPAARTGAAITGEATPGYLWHPLVPQRVHDSLPAAKLIVLLRNPIDRAFSQYQHDMRKWRAFPPFADAIEQEAAALDDELEVMFADPTYLGRSLTRQGYLLRGIYVLQLKRWRQYFPPEQLLIIKSEDFFAEPATWVKRVFEFLGLPVVLRPFYPPMGANAYAPLDLSMRARLAAYFRPFNEMLYEYLGLDYGWDKQWSMSEPRPAVGP